MNFRISTKSFFSSTQILLPVLLIIATIAVLQNGTFLNNIYSSRQPASVASGINGCYTEGDVGVLQSTKSVTETKLQDTSFELSRITNQIDETVFALDTNYIELESLKSSLISEDTLIALRAEIDLVETKLVESQQTPADSGVCSAYGYYDKKSCESAGEYENGSCTGGPQYQDEVSCLSVGSYEQGSCSDGRYYDKYSCENAGTEQWGYGPGSTSEYCTGGGGGYSYTDYNSCTNAGYYNGGGCNGPYYDKYSCENAGGFSSGWCSGGSIHSDQYSCETAGFSPGYCSGGSQYENEPACLSAGAYAGRCSDETYPDENSCVNALCQSSPAFCTDGTFETYEDCVPGGHTWYTAQSQACGNTWTPPSSGYNFTWYPGSPAYGYQWYPPMFTPAGHTWTEPTFYSYNYSWNQTWYAQWMQWFSSYGYTWTEPAWVSAGYQWTPGAFRNYGYTWIPTPPTTEQEALTQTLALLSDEYMQKIEQRSALMPLIQTAEEASTTLSLLLVEQTAQKANVKARYSELQQKVDELISELTYSVQSMCQTVETACSNIVDDDNDGQLDCSDSDCVSDSVCTDTTTNTTNVTGTTQNTITTQYVPPAPPVSPRYQSLFDSVVSKVDSAVKKNTNTIVPHMESLRSIATSGNLEQIFALMESIKGEIKSDQDIVVSIKDGLSKLRVENELTTKSAAVQDETELFVTSGIAFTDALNSYFSTLLQFLTGAIPTPTLEDILNTKIIVVSHRGGEYNQSVKDLNRAIEVAKSTPAVSFRAVSLAPIAGESNVSVTVGKVVVTFAQPLESYTQADVRLTSTEGTIIPSSIYIDGLDGKKLVMEIPNTLRHNTTYSVSADIQFTLIGGGTAYWKKTWSFSTEQDVTFVGGVIDFIKDLFGGNKKKDPEICDDGIDNNDDGNVDCSDELCTDKPICKVPVCGDGVLDKGEECDDGNNQNEDGCTSYCMIEGHSTACIQDPEDGLYYVENSDPKKECPKPEEKKSFASCLICEYQDDDEFAKKWGTDPHRFQKECERIAKTVNKSIISKDIGNVASQCPDNTNTFIVRLLTHSCKIEYEKLGSRIRDILDVTRFSGASYSKEYDGDITIDALDTGCHSAGGEYDSGDPDGIHKNFTDTLKIGSKLRFYNNVNISQTVNQTFGYTTGDDNVDIGAITLKGKIIKNERPFMGIVTETPNRYSESPDVSFEGCPEIGSWCLAPYAAPFLIQEPILCGNSNSPSRYYCKVEEKAEAFYGLYRGSWRKTSVQ